jgi:hypothetical protein
VLDVLSPPRGERYIDGGPSRRRRRESFYDAVSEGPPGLVHNHESRRGEVSPVGNRNLNQAGIGRRPVVPADTGHPEASRRLVDAGAQEPQGAGVGQPALVARPCESDQQPFALGQSARVPDDHTRNGLLPPTGSQGAPDPVLADFHLLEGAAVNHGQVWREH